MNQSAPIYISYPDSPCLSHGNTHMKPNPHKARHTTINRQQKSRSHSKSPSDRVNPIGYRSAHYRVGRNDGSPRLSQSCNKTHSVPIETPSDLPSLDDEALAMFRICLKARRPTRHARTLERLLNRKMDLDADSISSSLNTILDLADKVFFSNKLRDRMEWRWSNDTDVGYDNDFLGTTTPQYLVDPENPTKIRTRADIVLSRPLLRSKKYKSSLLISTFVHELVHCYLFICCGRQAEHNGGHTGAFHKIVADIKDWLQNDELLLCNMKADLRFFEQNPEPQLSWKMDDGFVLVDRMASAPTDYNISASFSADSPFQQWPEPSSLSSSWAGISPVASGLDTLSRSYYSMPNGPAYVSLQDRQLNSF